VHNVGYDVTFTPTDTSNYETIQIVVYIVVAKGTQTIPNGTTILATLTGLSSATVTNLGDDYEYAYGQTIIWQNSNVFIDLAPDTEYTFYARLKTTDNYNASVPISSTPITTPLTPERFLLFRSQELHGRQL
jgi:hypothetical protein